MRNHNNHLSSFHAHTICDFISGDVPSGGPYYLPNEYDTVPIDENGNPRINLRSGNSIGDNGRGRLLTILKELNLKEEVTDGQQKQLFYIIRDLTAFMSDVGAHFKAGKGPLDFSISYRLYNPEFVFFYQEPSNPEFIEYRSKLEQLRQSTQAGKPVSEEFFDSLIENEDKLFGGEENAQARTDKMDERVRMHLSDPLVNLALIIMLYGVDRLEELERVSLAERAKHSYKDPIIEQAELVEDFDTESRVRTLYPNSKKIDISKQFVISKVFADSLSRTLNSISKHEAKTQYENQGRSRKPVYKSISTDKKNYTELLIDPDRMLEKTADEFARQVERFSSATTMQGFLALQKYASLKDSYQFQNVPISEIMELILKPSGTNKFSKKDRQAFSETLEDLAAVAFNFSYQVVEINSKTQKRRSFLREEKAVKILGLKADYSVKRQFQSLLETELLDEHYDRSVITKITGSLFPDHAHLFTGVAYPYFDSLLEMDANKDSVAFKLGFSLQTRFNQFPDKTQCIEYDRVFLVGRCGYTKTDQQKASIATGRLKNTLDKLIKAGIISNYTGLTNINTDKVKMYPPKIVTKLAKS